MFKPEILAPAGNLDKLKTAINFGADAVYLGGHKLNLRAFANNFNYEQLKEGVEYAHVRGKRVYVTLNAFPHNEDFEGLEEYLKELEELNVDAIIVADPGIFMIAKQTVPNMELHLSTQANTVNYKTCQYWYKQGVKRIVLARELTIEEIKELKKNLPEGCEIEAFVHGAMCISYSGRCLLSNYMVGRDANRGACAQPCRYKYHLMEEKRKEEYFPVYEDERGTYIMNSKDMCMIEHIPALVESGINSLKIEGRMKSIFYVASVVKAYREALDSYFENPEGYESNPKWMELLMRPSHRTYHTGFYFGKDNMQVYDSSAYERGYDIIGIVRSYENGIVTIEQRNKIVNGDSAEVMKPIGDNIHVHLRNMKDENGNEIESANKPQMIFTAEVDGIIEKNDIIVKSKGEK